MSAKAHPPELKKYMDKRLSRESPDPLSPCLTRLAVRLNGQRVVVGILRGFDPFMNLVLDEVKESMRGMSLAFLSFLSVQS